MGNQNVPERQQSRKDAPAFAGVDFIQPFDAVREQAREGQQSDGRRQFRQMLRRKRGDVEQLLRDAPSGFNICRAEEYPRDIDEEHRQYPAEPCGHFKAARHPKTMADHCRAVQGAPYDERPTRAVPKAADQKNDEQVDVCAEQPFPVSAQGDVNVRHQPARQRDVPSAPKILNVAGFVRGIEVDGQANVQNQRRAHRHVAITAEIQIKLHRIAQRRRPCFHH